VAVVVVMVLKVLPPRYDDRRSAAMKSPPDAPVKNAPALARVTETTQNDRRPL
jgi:hypothetical protein